MKSLVHFSPTETKVLQALGRKKMTITEIVVEVFGKKPPMDGNNAIAGAIRRINLKCDSKGLPWRLNGQGAGRAGRTVWKEDQ